MISDYERTFNGIYEVKMSKSLKKIKTYVLKKICNSLNWKKNWLKTTDQKELATFVPLLLKANDKVVIVKLKYFTFLIIF